MPDISRSDIRNRRIVALTVLLIFASIVSAYMRDVQEQGRVIDIPFGAKTLSFHFNP